jgi:hypothetical protein
MTPKQNYVAAANSYKAQYSSYKIRAALPDLTESEKEMLRTKKTMLIEIWEALKIYGGYVDSGKIPSREINQRLIDLSYQLERAWLKSLE